MSFAVGTGRIYVINALEKIRDHTPFPRGVCDIIASYAMSYGDLLAFMPWIWHQDDDEPYEYPEAVYGGRRVYCGGTFIRPEFDIFEYLNDTILELSGIDNLFELLAYCRPTQDNADMPILYMPHAEIRKISDYYENIARRCLNGLLRSWHRE